MTAKIIHGACLDVLPTLPDNSVDAVITDPPYGLSNATPEKITEAITRWASGERDYLPEVAGGFMGKAWDSFVPPVAVWDDCMRVLKPGGHMVVFAGSRTFDLMALAIRLAGFEIRDSLAWLYGSGFPKSLDVSKAIDKIAHVNDETHRRIALVAEVIRTHREAKGMGCAEVSEAVVGTRSGACWNWEHHQLPSVEMWPAIKRVLAIPDEFDGLIEGTREMFIGAEREVVGAGVSGKTYGMGGLRGVETSTGAFDVTTPATPDAERWQGWGTALKPAFEPVVLARKPLIGTVAANVQEHGTGALNIDGCRIGRAEGDRTEYGRDKLLDYAHESVALGRFNQNTPYVPDGGGRWPANVVLDEDQAAALDKQSGTLKGRVGMTQHGSGTNKVYGTYTRSEQSTGGAGTEDVGGASRFFFVAREDNRPCPSTSDVSTAGNHSSRPSEPDGSAPSGAATSDSPEEIFRSHSTEPSTSDMVSASRPNDESDTRPTPSTADGSSQESPLERLTQTPSHARNAETSGPIATTTTTTSRPISDGFADHATSSTTSTSRGHGDRDLPIDALDSRFTYTAKAPKKERPVVEGVAHPTVKPLTLMRWLVRLITPPGGTVLEPFAGSGTTVEAALLEGFDVIGVEREADYLPLIQARIDRATEQAAQEPEQPDLFSEGVA